MLAWMLGPRTLHDLEADSCPRGRDLSLRRRSWSTLASSLADICEAVTGANMRFVETKTPEQQSCLMLHRTRHLLIRQQTAVINAIRAHLWEFGIVAPLGRLGVEALLGVVADPKDKRVPEVARACLAALGAQLRVLKKQILEFDRMINAWHRSNETSKRLDDSLVSDRRWPQL
jgi:transposase